MRISGLASWVLGVGLAFGFTACNDSGGGGGGSGNFDFGDNDQGVVLCLGDSITEGECVPAGAPYPARLASMSGKTVINQGACGEKSGGGRDRVGSLLNRFKPGYICILYGANDAIFGLSVDEVVGNIRAIVQAAKANNTLPIVATCTPMFGIHEIYNQAASDYSVAIRQMAKEEGARLVDLDKEFGNDQSFLQADGLHPSDSGNTLIAMSFNDRI